MSSRYMIPRSVLYRLTAEREHYGPGNNFLHATDDFLLSQMSPGVRDDALMVLPYGEDASFAEKVPRHIRVLLMCLMASIAEEEGR